jgi:uncharacterized protein (TIGR00725 family)
VKRIRLISVIGAVDCDEREAAFAEEVGQLLAKAGFGVVCGGRGGVMEAVCRGAWEHGGFTVGILPSVDRNQANPFLSVALPTGLNEARNVLVVLAGEAVLAIGGGYGTLTEIAHALKHRKPVVGFQTWRGHRPDLAELSIHRVESPAEAVNQIRVLIGTST